jgi:biotin carboxyl carrier protein
LPVGAVVCCMAGLVLSIDVAVGDPVAVGDQVATIEAMKMRRQVQSSQKGVVREIRVKEGEIVDPDDVLMVVS